MKKYRKVLRGWMNVVWHPHASRAALSSKKDDQYKEITLWRTRSRTNPDKKNERHVRITIEEI